MFVTPARSSVQGRRNTRAVRSVPQFKSSVLHIVTGFRMIDACTAVIDSEFALNWKVTRQRGFAGNSPMLGSIDRGLNRQDAKITYRNAQVMLPHGDQVVSGQVRQRKCDRFGNPEGCKSYS